MFGNSNKGEGEDVGTDWIIGVDQVNVSRSRRWMSQRGFPVVFIEVRPPYIARTLDAGDDPTYVNMIKIRWRKKGVEEEDELRKFMLIIIIKTNNNKNVPCSKDAECLYRGAGGLP